MTALDPRFICTSDLQEILRDNATGLPLAGGIVTFYSDINRETLKPIYQLSSNGSSVYQYSPLPNPCTLSMAGTFQDALGNDIVPYYYPFTGTPVQQTNSPELYYITVDNSGFTRQFTRQGWPQSANSGNNEITQYIYNYIRNPQFYAWSLLPPTSTFPSGTVTGFPDVAGGFTNNNTTLDTADDWYYHINDSTQTIAINRIPFAEGQTTVPGNPVYYWQYVNTAIGSGVATINYLSQTLNSVYTLQGQIVTISFWMQITPTDLSSQNINVQLAQFFGSNSIVSPNPNYIPVITITAPANSNWIFYTTTLTVPPISSSQPLGTNQDDSLALVFTMPLNITVTVNIANVLMQTGSITSPLPIKSNNDQYNASDLTSRYSIFRTGDVKMTLRSAVDPGWLLMDDTLIGNTKSAATHTGWSLFNLYSLLWNNVQSPIWAPLFTSSGVPVARSANAYLDWTANNQLALTKVLGRALAGAGSSLTEQVIQGTTGTSGNPLALVLTGTTPVLPIFTGTPFTISSTGSLPGGLTAGTTYYAITTSTVNTIYVATTLAAAVDFAQNPSGAIPWTSNSSGVTTFSYNGSAWVLGQYFGEQNHAILVSELASHNHPNSYIASIDSKATNTSGTNSVISPLGTPLTVNYGLSITSQGGDQSHNIMQPTSFFNVMIKI